MRHRCATTNHAKFLAKRLRAALADRSVEVSLASCQDTVAVAHGFAHWHELSSNVGVPQDGGPFEGGLAALALGHTVARRHGLSDASALGVGISVMTHDGTRAAPMDKEPTLAPNLSGTEWLLANRVGHDRDGLDRDACGTAFARQLGAPWKGLDGAPTYVRCLAVAFAIHTEGPREVAEAFRRSLADVHASMPAGEGRDRACEGLLAPMVADARLVARIDKVASGHGWTSTVLVAMLDRARRFAGVLATVEFDWLTRVDLALYRVLNSVGRRSHHVEASGAIAHHDEERAAGHAISTPSVAAAVDAMEQAIGDRNLPQDIMDRLAALKAAATGRRPHAVQVGKVVTVEDPPEYPGHREPPFRHSARLDPLVTGRHLLDHVGQHMSAAAAMLGVLRGVRGNTHALLDEVARSYEADFERVLLRVDPLLVAGEAQGLSAEEVSALPRAVLDACEAERVRVTEAFGRSAFRIHAVLLANRVVNPGMPGTEEHP